MKNLLLPLMQLSISAHNSQPYKLKQSDNIFEIVGDSSRSLPIADPHGRDYKIGLGALYETFDIGLSSHGLKIRFINDRQFVVEKSSGPLDPLNSVLSTRFSYRGRFDEKTSVPKSLDCGKSTKLLFLSSEADKKEIGSVFDRVNLKFLTLPGYVDELYEWLRFSPTHPRWSLDGLNTESMGLNKVDAFGASRVLRPRMFKFLNLFKVLPMLLSEAPVIRSSSAIVCITCQSNDPLEIGRGFMRGWLVLTSIGLYGAPLSLLTDDAEASAHMRSLFELRPSDVICNILRMGPLSKNFKVPTRCRLSLEDLYVGI